MSLVRSQALLIGVVVTMGISSIPGWAADGGKWRGRAVLVTTSETLVDIGDKADHQVAILNYDGLVFTEVGGDFLANARYQVTHLGDFGGDIGDGGYKTFTMADDSKVFAQYKPTEVNMPVIKGEWKFLGGTGRYQGITGTGTYEVHQLNDKVLWDILEGEYKLP